MYQVKIISLNSHNEIEWEEIIESSVSLRAAMNKATRWIDRNLLKSDYDRIEKDRSIGKRTTWWVL